MCVGGCVCLSLLPLCYSDFYLSMRAKFCKEFGEMFLGVSGDFVFFVKTVGAE